MTLKYGKKIKSVVDKNGDFDGVFTLADTDTNTDTDKMGLQPICISVGVGVNVSDCVCVGQYEDLHTILHNPFFYRRRCRPVWTLHKGTCEETLNFTVERSSMSYISWSVPVLFLNWLILWW